MPSNAWKNAYFYFKVKGLRPNVPPDTSFNNYLRRLAFDSSGYCKYGLHHDDLLYEYPDVKEAVRRLPQKLQDERNFRILRAIQVEIRNELLPKEEWTKWEDCTSNRYLQPYLDEVRREMKEVDEWKANYY